MRPIDLPQPLQRRVAAAVRSYLGGSDAIDFTQPAKEAALAPPDSVSWQIFKNPVALYVGGIAAVVLELAQPRVRSGVWDHGTFRADPLGRLRRTGLAAMVTVYGARSVAEEMIAGITRRHAKVRGKTPQRVSYRALDPELMRWVQVTASFGFVQAYHRFVRPLSRADRDRAYAEAIPGALLYGARDSPRTEEELEQLFEATYPSLERSQIVLDFLDIMARTRALPMVPRRVHAVLIRAGVELLPTWARTHLGLCGRGLRPWEAQIVRLLGRSLDRIVVPSAPPALACIRMGLPPDYLYAR